MFVPGLPLHLSLMFLVRPGAYPSVNHLKGPSLRSYSKTLDYAEKACLRQTLQLITDIRKLQP